MRSRAPVVWWHDPDPIDRHFMFCELEWRLYRLRDVEPDTLADYDAVCEQHDGEMDRIGPALLAKFGAMPLLETYKQQCVRQQKAKDFTRGLWWAERGLALYTDVGREPGLDRRPPQAPRHVPGEAVGNGASSRPPGDRAGTGHRGAGGADVHTLRLHVGASPSTWAEATAVPELRWQGRRRTAPV